LNIFLERAWLTKGRQNQQVKGLKLPTVYGYNPFAHVDDKALAGSEKQVAWFGLGHAGGMNDYQ
jgi:hypothetical protein